MIEPINIYNSDNTIHLSMGVYDVFIIGGWNLNLGKFSFRLNKINNAKIVKPEILDLRVQSYFKNKRTKKAFSFVITKGGMFNIEFENQDSLFLKKSHFIFGGVFEKKIKNKSIEILIERN